MYTIIMGKSKELITTKRTSLFQREKLVDKIQFLFPQFYEDIDLTECTATIKYIDQGNVPHSETLVKDIELYKERIRYVLPVDTDLTRFAGDITLRITLSKFDMENTQYNVLHTGEATITILPLADYFAFATDESLEIVDQLRAETEAVKNMMLTISEGQANGLTLTDDYLQLAKNKEPFGEGVTIVVPSLDDALFDGVDDGILDLDSIATEENPTEPETPSDDTEDENGFIEL